MALLLLTKKANCVLQYKGFPFQVGEVWNVPRNRYTIKKHKYCYSVGCSKPASPMVQTRLCFCCYKSAYFSPQSSVNDMYLCLLECYWTTKLITDIWTCHTTVALNSNSPLDLIRKWSMGLIIPVEMSPCTSQIWQRTALGCQIHLVF